jgi:hypothetical protein
MSMKIFTRLELCLFHRQRNLLLRVVPAVRAFRLGESSASLMSVDDLHLRLENINILNGYGRVIEPCRLKTTQHS